MSDSSGDEAGSHMLGSRPPSRSHSRSPHRFGRETATADTDHPRSHSRVDHLRRPLSQSGRHGQPSQNSTDQAIGLTLLVPSIQTKDLQSTWDGPKDGQPSSEPPVASGAPGKDGENMSNGNIYDDGHGVKDYQGGTATAHQEAPVDSSQAGGQSTA